MEALLLVLVLAVLALPTVIIVLFARVRRLEARLKSLEAREGKLEAPAQVRGPAPAARSEPVLPRAASKAQAPATRAQESAKPAARPPVAKPEPKPAAPHGEIRWEQWLGVRGAALLGGLLLALAGILLFKHALDKNWITPELRVLSGALVGLAALATSEFFRRRDYQFAPAATAGAGVVVLYATIWASQRLYGFLPTYAALPLMALVTGACAWLSVRFQAQLVAVLGLVGGFATPLLLAISAEQPVGLFGYLLLLDLGLVALGLRMRWPLLGVLGVLGTYGVTLIWLVLFGSGDWTPLFLCSLGATALLFAAAGLRSPASARRAWFTSQAGALLLPFAFTTYFAAITDFGERLWPLATLMAFLAVAASWVGTKQDAKWLVTGAASGALAVCAIWLARLGSSEGAMVEFAACTVGLSAVFVIAERLFGRSPLGAAESRWAAPIAPAIAGVGFAVMTAIASMLVEEPSPWPWLAAALGQALVLHLAGRAKDAGPLRAIGAGAAGLTLGLYLAELGDLGPGPWPTLGWMLASALFFLGLVADSARRDGERELRWAWHGAAAFPCALLAFLPESGALVGASPELALAITTALALLILVPALARGWSPWYLVALGLFLGRHALWIGAYLAQFRWEPIPAHLFYLELVALALLAAAPLASRRRLATTRLAWAGAALFLCVSLGNAQRLFGPQLDSQGRWPAPAWLAAVAIGVAFAARGLLVPDARSWRRALRWLLGAACLLASLAVARRVGPDIVAIAFSLTGLGLAILWRALPNAGLKGAALASLFLGALALAARVVLVFHGQEHFEKSSQLVFNWTSYASGVPALCALGAALLIGPRELEHLSALERKSALLERAWCTSSAAVLAALLVFVWLNLQVYLYFEPGPWLDLDLDTHPQRDLTLSVTWIVYALALLAGGMARGVAGLRQLSLAFLLLTLVKVFLHDLGDLRGLYRVGSLAGLAVSLLGVSLVYQRFVFPRKASSSAPADPGAPAPAERPS